MSTSKELEELMLKSLDSDKSIINLFQKRNVALSDENAKLRKLVEDMHGAWLGLVQWFEEVSEDNIRDSTRTDLEDLEELWEGCTNMRKAFAERMAELGLMSNE